ncbi:regulatory subunit of cAMP-dependent protein kinase [Fimbriimonas ginsengisoli Gsoil 348]|uniref:Regulatory subunit of cAMP-dependent protein kinase n=2 Tax=Fimbriimonas ginsengisoli TaxID=1005039 RepID=A0A068NYF8_FIMGI|nr:regulatory subunit of cAMP-dependent protein kinase [Fimbriimonas ginsengisoli Gsoil 348]
MNVQDAIRESYLAQGFTEEQLEQLYAIAEERSYVDGEPILRQFDDSQDLLILASGRANILTVIGEPIGVVKPGMPLGEISFLDSKPRSVSVVSSGPSDAVVLPAGPLRKILQERPDIALRALLNISRVLCARLRAANNNIAALMAIDESETSLSRG